MHVWVRERSGRNRKKSREVICSFQGVWKHHLIIICTGKGLNNLHHRTQSSSSSSSSSLLLSSQSSSSCCVLHVCHVFHNCVSVFLCLVSLPGALQCVLHVSSAQLGAGNLKTGRGHISLPSYKSSSQDHTNVPLF